MATASLAHQVEGVERGIAFLRQEQLALLRGLHLEILSLEKRCTELTCDLKVKPPGRSQADIQEEEEQLESRCREVEGRLVEQQLTVVQLQQELSQKGTLVGALRASLKDKERRFLEELKRRSHQTTVLNTELQKQTEAAAYLSFQLHAATQKLQHQQQRSSGTPPPTSAKAKRRHGSKHPAHIRAERARECVPRERVTAPEEPRAMPDPALFFQPRRHRPRPRHQHRLPLDGRDGGEEHGEPPERAPPRLAAAAATIAAEGKAE
ncbi:coiled-coil domain-containing protein 92 isoform X2 [Denticeps clupeoides]|uniref:CCDC92/74 N-terminal domain-containing protein n=2 Tax=Denticeps clupeoides TaxID=299321 RepID=A0AAY4D0E5_9TELE|nr:coiled-coil domain containing 92B isoform X2 [Denticeps clupeoides]XP_028856622.1 coiled-coil domain containing 92B isoform X2 [Denticeps clupeoides]